MLAAAALLAAPLATAALAQRRASDFSIANGFSDEMTIVSGRAEAHSVGGQTSAAFFQTTGVRITGLTEACWTLPATPPQCVHGPLGLAVPDGSSFGLKPAAPLDVDLQADHVLATFVDLSGADGFSGLHAGPSLLASVVGGTIGFASGAGGGEAHGGVAALEPGSTVNVVGADGRILHALHYDDPPLVVQGAPQATAPFGATVVVLPFADGSSTLTLHEASAAAASQGLSPARFEMLDQVLRDVRFLDPAAKSGPAAILAKAGSILTEVFNGAFIRTQLADDPSSLADVAFARFTDLTINGDDSGSSLAFDGSYTLVLGDLGPAFKGSSVSGGSLPVRWWVAVLVLTAVLVTGAWLWLRQGPIQVPQGPLTVAARLCTAAGAVGLALLWDWRLDKVLGSSLLTTGASGASLGLLATVEAASLLLAFILIGVPIYLAARNGLALAKQVRWAPFSSTAAVAGTAGLGMLLLPALVAFLINLGIGA